MSIFTEERKTVIYNPIVDMIFEWLKKQGSPTHWIFEFICSLPLFMAIIIWQQSSFWEARPFFVSFILIFGLGVYPVFLYEKHRKERDNENK